MNIDKAELKRITQGNKNQMSKDNKDIKAAMYPFSKEYMEWISKLSAYETASIILSKNSWVHNHKIHKNRLKNKLNGVAYKTYEYKPGDIVMVDLGGNNYGFEFSYYHPVVIVKNDYYLVIVAPTSTKQYNSGKPNVVDVKQSVNGFKEDSGVLINGLRSIDKSRIKLSNSKGGVLGNLGDDLKIVSDKIIEFNFSYHHKKIENLEKENEILKEQIENLEKEKIEKSNEKK